MLPKWKWCRCGRPLENTGNDKHRGFLFCFVFSFWGDPGVSVALKNSNSKQARFLRLQNPKFVFFLFYVACQSLHLKYRYKDPYKWKRKTNLLRLQYETQNLERYLTGKALKTHVFKYWLRNSKLAGYYCNHVSWKGLRLNSHETGERNLRRNFTYYYFYLLKKQSTWQLLRTHMTRQRRTGLFFIPLVV